MARVYGIGNPLIDYLCSIEDKDLSTLGLSKGTMLLIDTEKRKEILDYTKNRSIVYSCGGSCPNTMVTLCSMGVPTTLAGSVGNDELGHTYKERLKESGVKDHLVQKNEGVTGTSIILLTGDKERTMNTYLGANRLFSPEDVMEEEILASDLFYFTGYMWDTEPQQKAVMKAIEICRKHGKKIAFDIADPFAVGRYRATFLELIENYCDIVFANNEEARVLIDNYDTYECCRTIGKICNIAIVKDGKKGSYISDGGTITKISIEPKKPLDTTGAGDTYAAGFLLGYMTGRDNITSCHIASFLSGEIICQVGAQFPAERIPELQKTINERYPV